MGRQDTQNFILKIKNMEDVVSGFNNVERDLAEKIKKTRNNRWGKC